MMAERFVRAMVTAFAVMAIVYPVVLFINDRQPGAPKPVFSGPLGSGSEPGTEICSPTKTGIAYEGSAALQNRSRSDLALDSVRLVNAVGLEIEQAFVTPIYHTSLIGGAPPTDRNPAWRARVPLEGATLLAGDDLNLVLVLSIRAEKVGYSNDVEIGYHTPNGHKYRYRTGISDRVERGACSRETPGP